MLIDKLRIGVVVYGPYVRKDDNRKHVIIYWPAFSKRQTMSYPKWLLEQHLERFLTVDETVDHKNRDFTDDRIENLQILLKSKHASVDALRVFPVEVVCIYCSRSFQRKAAVTRHSSKLGKAGPFCSKSCSGSYGADLQNGKINKFPIQDGEESVYYKLAKT